MHAIAELTQRVQPQSPKGSVSVRVDNDSDAASTVLSLEADSRPGLLTALTGTFKALGLEVVKASVDAQNGRICDTFHVQDAFGAKITPGDAVNVKRSLEVGISTLYVTAVQPALLVVCHLTSRGPRVCYLQRTCRLC